MICDALATRHHGQIGRETDIGRASLANLSLCHAVLGTNDSSLGAAHGPQNPKTRGI